MSLVYPRNWRAARSLPTLSPPSIHGPHERLAPVPARAVPRASGQVPRHAAHRLRAVVAALDRALARVPAGARPLEPLSLAQVDHLRGARAGRHPRGTDVVRRDPGARDLLGLAHEGRERLDPDEPRPSHE